MSSLVQADIFFFITSVSVLVLTALLIVIALYVLRIVKDFKEVVKIFRTEAKETLNDFKEFREQVKSEKNFFKKIFEFYFKGFKKSAKSRTSHK